MAEKPGGSTPKSAPRRANDYKVLDGVNIHMPMNGLWEISMDIIRLLASCPDCTSSFTSSSRMILLGGEVFSPKHLISRAFSPMCRKCLLGLGLAHQHATMISKKDGSQNLRPDA